MEAIDALPIAQRLDQGHIRLPTLDPELTCQPAEPPQKSLLCRVSFLPFENLVLGGIYL